MSNRQDIGRKEKFPKSMQPQTGPSWWCNWCYVNMDSETVHSQTCSQEGNLSQLDMPQMCIHMTATSIIVIKDNEEEEQTWNTNSRLAHRILSLDPSRNAECYLIEYRQQW
jgi:hypothetical protein